MKNNNNKSFAKSNKAVHTRGKVKTNYLRFALGVSSTGIFQKMAAIAQGTTNYQRTGDLIRLADLQFNALCVYGDAVGNPMRVVIFQTVGGFTPGALSDLFAFGGTGAEDITSQFLPNLLGRRIRLLYDELLTMNPGGSNGLTIRRGWLKPSIREIEYTAGTTNIINGEIWVVALTDSAAIPHPALDISIEIPYTDA
jgi:hypothetical protein